MGTVVVNKQKKYNNTLKKTSLLKAIFYYKYIYLLLLPGIAFFILFSYMPMYGIQLAFKDYWINKGIWGSPWVGLDKFKLIVGAPEFWSAFKNTLVLSFLKTSIGFPIPITLAILINELKFRKLSRTLQTIYTFPHFLSWVVLSGIVMNLLGNEGAINNLIAITGGERVSFLADPNIFRVLVIVTDIWKESGWSCIMYLAAMAAIDPALYESATIDGANRWHRAIFITWPGVRDMATILLILAIGNAMNANFDQIYNLAVFSSADILDTYVYRISFQLQGDFGFSTAVGLFKGVINCGLLLTANAIVKKFNKTSIF
jgi:putative aldouronate transport system permease protein